MFPKNINAHIQEKELAPCKTLKQPIGRLWRKLKTTFVAKKEIRWEDNLEMVAIPN